LKNIKIHSSKGIIGGGKEYQTMEGKKIAGG
jgi:hypothetical protein